MNGRSFVFAERIGLDPCVVRSRMRGQEGVSMAVGNQVTTRVSRRFAAEPWRVFDALLDPAAIRVWMPACASGEVVRLRNDPRPGGAFAVGVRRGDEVVEHSGAYVTIDKPFRLVFTWNAPHDPRTPATVTIDMVRAGTGTDLVLAHDGGDEDSRLATERGWRRALDGIASWL